MEFVTPLLPHAAASLGIALVVSSNTPLVLLDDELLIIAASSSFCQQFGLNPSEVMNRTFFELGQGEWNIPQLASLLRATAAGSAKIDAYECLLRRDGLTDIVLLVHAHRLALESSEQVYLVLALTDVTELRQVEKQKDDLIRDKQNLLHELQHRVANSLQIIASVLIQSARRVQSEEASAHLQNAHHRVMSIATLQRMLASRGDDEVALAEYLFALCESIAASMIADPTRLKLLVVCDDSRTSADKSVSIGLIVTELVINALKHGYSRVDPAGTITVTYESKGPAWSLSVGDDGVGMPDASTAGKPGLGTGIVQALANQLKADTRVSDAHPGTLVTLTHSASPQEAEIEVPLL